MQISSKDWDGEQKTWLVTAHPDDKGKWSGVGKTSRTADNESGLVQGNPSQSSPQGDSATTSKAEQPITRANVETAQQQAAQKTEAKQEQFADNKLFTADKVAAARERMRKKLGTLNSGIDPELLVDGMTIAGAYIESGIRSFADYAKAMVEDMGDGVKPYLLSFWEGARNYPGLDTTGMTDPAGAARLAQQEAQADQSSADFTENAEASPRSDNGGQQGAQDGKETARHFASGLPRTLPVAETAQSRTLENKINNWLARSGRAGRVRFRQVRPVSLPDALNRALDRLHDTTGTRVVLFRNLTPEVEDFNGVNFRDGTLYISEDSQHPVTLAAAHEWVHNLKRTNPQLYQELEDEVRRQGRLDAWHERNVKEEGQDRGRDHAIEELTAAAVSDALTDPVFLQRLAERDQSAFRRVAKAFLKFLKTLTNGWKDQGSNAYLQDVEAFRDKLEQVLDKLPAAKQKPGLIEALFLRVWHGTPHRGIEKTGFRLNKIGTGEGAQAYGWGMYFASMREVAKEYADKLSGAQVYFDKSPSTQYELEVVDAINASLRTAQSGARGMRAREVWQQFANPLRDRLYGNAYAGIKPLPEAELKRALGLQEAALRLGEPSVLNEGQLYSLDLPVEESDLLDWDKPLSEQPEKVRRALIRADVMDESALGEYTGQQFYEGMVRDRMMLDGMSRSDSAKAASEYLQSIGIPGLRYLDGNSRSGGQGSHNYVIWDEALMTPEAADIQPMFSRRAGKHGANTNPDILYSKSGKPVTNPTAVKMRRAMVQRTVDALAKGWAKAPNVTVVDSMQDERVPEAVRKADAAQRSQGAMGEPEGFWYRGQVYLVASALPTSADAARVLYHEVLGHHGLRGHFGKDLDRVLDQVIKLRRKDVQAKAQEYGLDMGNPEHAGYAAEEVLAELAQTRPDLGFVQRAIAAIRNFLRAHVPGFKALELTDADIVQGYLLPARGWVERGADAGSAADGPMLSRSGNADTEAQRQFKETERAYGGKAAYDRAKAAGKTKLTYGQWVQVRTPNFKAWFGDWEAVRAQERLDAMEPVQVRVPDAWRGLGHAELRQKMAEELDRMVREKTQIEHPELGMIQVGRAGAKKTSGSARDPAKSLVAADIEALIPASIYARTEPSRGGDGPDIEGYSTLLARVDVDGVPLVASFTVRHQSDGQWYYNAVALHDGKEKAQDSYGRPDQQAGSRFAPIAGLSDFIRRPLARVNPEAVSKVVDSATGEPLVVYHGTGADFSVFDGKKSGSHTREVDARKGFFLSSSPEIASEYAEEAGANGGANIMPAYVSLQNPLVIDEGGRNYDPIRFNDYIVRAKEQGHDGVLPRNTGDGMSDGSRGRGAPCLQRRPSRGGVRPAKRLLRWRDGPLLQWTSCASSTVGSLSIAPVAANYWRTPVQESNDKKAKAKSNPTSSQARQLLTKTLAYLGEKDNDHNLQRLARRREKQGK